MPVVINDNVFDRPRFSGTVPHADLSHIWRFERRPTVAGSAVNPLRNLGTINMFVQIARDTVSWLKDHSKRFDESFYNGY
jgi:hypothetical protein